VQKIKLQLENLSDMSFLCILEYNEFLPDILPVVEFNWIFILIFLKLTNVDFKIFEKVHHGGRALFVVSGFGRPK
jgi:hypothetical protein